MTEAVDLLLVDDEPRNLDALEAILANPGYRLLRATHADSALKLLVEHDVAVIVLDIKMPGTTGFELAQTIKATKRYREIPILFLTAYLVDDRDILAGYGAGAVDYLTKPLNPEILRRKVAVFAELFRKTRALALLNETLEERVRERTAELERSEAALRAADHNKDEFIAVLAHELRNPLTPLVFGVESIARHLGRRAPDMERSLSAMKHQLDHMVRLIDDLLDISRIGHGHIELKREPTDLASVLAAAVDMNRAAIQLRRHALTVEAAPGTVVDGDPTRLVQIVGNLLHNAVRFTPDGGTVTLGLRREGAHALVTVADSGEGIAEGQIERAFQMFARLGKAGATTEPGLGIGLALGRHLAEMHGGTLTAASEGLGRGAAFTLRLPLLANATMPSHASPSAPPVAPLDIVVIEDSEDITDMLSSALESLGHSVAAAYTGTSGVALVAARKPDVVLCDIGLPDIDGAEVCRQIRGLVLDRRPVMIALTGWGRARDRLRTRAAGFDEHLVKPVAAEKLQRVLWSFTH